MLSESPEMISKDGVFMKWLKTESHSRSACRALKQLLDTTRPSKLAPKLIETGVLSVVCGFADTESIQLAILIVRLCSVFPDHICGEIESQLPNLFALRSDELIDPQIAMSIHLTCNCPRTINRLIESKVLNVAHCGLQTRTVCSRQGAAQLIGCICRHVPLPADYGNTILPELFQQLDAGDVNLTLLVLFAIGNIFFHPGSVQDRWNAVISKGIRAVAGSLNSPDKQIVDHGLKAVTNIVRQSETFVGDLINSQILEKLVALRNQKDPLGERAARSLDVFSRYAQVHEALARLNTGGKRH
jgi:hypothetical protein